MLAAVLLIIAGAAHAEHFEFKVELTGTYAGGGTDGCYPPDFNQPACPQPGSLSAILSFDTPSSADGSYLIADGFGEVTDFAVSLGSLQSATEALYGGINLNDGIASGTVQAFDQSETFSFNWADRIASYSFNGGDYGGSGVFTGFLSAVPEPAMPILMLLGLASLAGSARRRGAAS
jgi:hypothetical protein